MTPTSYFRELRADPFAERPDSIEAVWRFCERYPLAHAELAIILMTWLCKAAIPGKGGNLIRPESFLAA